MCKTRLANEWMKKVRVAVALTVAPLTHAASAGSSGALDDRGRFVIVATVTMPKEAVPEAARLIPVTFDARFAIRVKVDRVVSGAAPWKSGSEHLLLIHSPSVMFGRHDLKGERFHFTFEVNPAPSPKDCRYCLVELKREGRRE